MTKPAPTAPESESEPWTLAGNCFEPSFLLKRAVAVLQAGGVVAHATEGVWGLACAIGSERGIRTILDMKGRSVEKGMIVIAEDARRFEKQLQGLERRAEILASWPGPVTWLVPGADFSPLIRGLHNTVAVRVPGHAQSRALCALAGTALVSTSANPQGKPPARNALRVRQYFPHAFSHEPGILSFLLPGERSLRSSPSTIRDAITGEVKRT